MNRTKDRPLATGRLKKWGVLLFVLVLGITGETFLFWKVNALCGWLGLSGMFVYVVVYTIWLKLNSPGARPSVGYPVLCRRCSSIVCLIVLVAARSLLVTCHSAGGGVQRSRLSAVTSLQRDSTCQTVIDNDRWAKTNFLISVNYLMLVFFMMIIDTVVRPF